MTDVAASPQTLPAERIAAWLPPLIAVAIALLCLFVAGMPPRWTPGAVSRVATGGVSRPAPAAIPPKPEPLVLLEITPERARAINAAVPFVAGRVPAARPFRFPGSAEDRARAEACLASAVWYEAGNDVVGQRAVAQVVLNRLRHPAFPKTVCGVVFEGSERTTGCQFTFTCDGAMARVPSPEQWRVARQVAERALSGFVFDKVGLATHYHTDWVVPYWSASLDKVAAVDTHLFFRWRGWWGTPPAFRRGYAGGEVVHPRLANLFGPPAAGEPSDETVLAPGGAALPAHRPALHVEGVPGSALKGNIVRMIGETGAEFVLELDPAAYSGSYAFVALSLCKGRPVCTVIGWIDPGKLPAALPVPPAMARTATFVYRRNSALNREQVYWNCRERPREDATRCLPGTEPRPAEAGRPDTPSAPQESAG